MRRTKEQLKTRLSELEKELDSAIKEQILFNDLVYRSIDIHRRNLIDTVNNAYNKKIDNIKRNIDSVNRQIDRIVTVKRGNATYTFYQ